MRTGSMLIARIMRRGLSAITAMRYMLGHVWIRMTRPGVGFAMGKSPRVESGVRLRCSDGGSIILGPAGFIGRGVEVVAQGGSVSIGADTFIGPWTTITAKEAVSIGRDCLIGERVTIRDQNHCIHGAAGVPIRNSGFEVVPISISDDVWVGAGAVILPGAAIARGAVVAANAVVTGNVHENEVVGGVPARHIGFRKTSRP